METTSPDVAAPTPMALWSLRRMAPGCSRSAATLARLGFGQGDLEELEAAGLVVRDCIDRWRPTRAADLMTREHRVAEARKRVEGKRKAHAERHTPATSRARWTGEA